MVKGTKVLHGDLFCGQRLEGFRPFFSVRRKIIFGFSCSLLCLVGGIVFTVLGEAPPEYELRYDGLCPVSPTLCIVNLTITADLSGKVALQYKLAPFHQNHRRFLWSRVPAQLRGEFVDFDGLSAAVPYRSRGDSRDPQDWLLPSGAFACLAFNDTFEWPGSPFDEFLIADPTEFADDFKALSEKYADGVKWLRGNPAFPDGERDPHFVRWMRPAAASTVVKEYGICQNCRIPKGTYAIGIRSNYPVDLYGGMKAIVVGQRTAVSGEAKFLGLALFVIAAVMAAVATVLLMAEILRPVRPRMPLVLVVPRPGGPRQPDGPYGRIR
jgi:hypothetical protein